MFWNDDFLVWNATEFGGIDKLHLPATAIWRPDLIVYGAVKTEFALPLEDTVAVVQSNGRVAVELAQVVQMFCVFDIELFPFDKQNCTMEFGSWTYSLDRVAFAPLKDNGSTEFLRDQLEWEIISFESNLLEGVYELGDSFKNETFDELYYHFVFKRKPTFYIIYLVIPSFLITLLSVIGLFAPFSSSGERQEKVTLGLTSLFAMALILDIVSKEIPKTSKGIPLLGRFVLYELIIIALAVLTAVVIISFHKATVLRKEPPPRWLLRFLLLKQADAKRRTRRIFIQSPLLPN
uniref:Uncharacterized protein n=1 Tax=Plectus sambesii TaxID=2011161 RepID=A0A914VNB8_9BILA